MNLLSTAREADLDRITRTAQHVFGTEIALVSLVDKDRQWFKSRRGLDAPETPRDISFCGHAIAEEQTFVIPNAIKDDRFHDNPLVTDGPKIRFYAGQPLTNEEGYRIGTLCVISPAAREFSTSDEEVLQNLGRMVEIVLSNRKLSEIQLSLLDSLAAANRDKLIDSLTGVWNRGGFDELLDREIARAERENEPIAIAMIDIDEFKSINDICGHVTGDQAIKLTADLLSECSRTTDVVARFGGDEFAIILPGVVPTTLPSMGDKLMRMFRKKAKLDTPEGEQAFTISVGMTVSTPKPGQPTEATALIAAADDALYVAKAAGRDGFEISGGPENLYANFALA